MIYCVGGVDSNYLLHEIFDSHLQVNGKILKQLFFQKKNILKMALHLSSKSFSQNRQYIPASILHTEKRRPRNYMICLIAQPGLNEVQRHLRWCSSYLTRQNFQIPMGLSKSNLSFHFFSIEFSQCINGSHIHITTNTKKH